MDLNIDKLRCGDIDDLEDFFGISFGDLQSMGADKDGNVDLSKLPPKMMTGMAFLVGRQNDPGFTREQARAVPLGELLADEDEKPKGKLKAAAPLPGAAA